MKERPILTQIINCPYVVGTKLYVRETFAPVDLDPDEHGCPDFIYKAVFSAEAQGMVKWKPSIHMPKRAARIWLEVTKIRVERVQDIIWEDAKAEGVQRGVCTHPDCYPGSCAVSSYVAAFAELWDSLNEKRGYGWQKNPHVWVYDFKIIKK